MDQKKYLDRINFSSALTTNIHTLNQLQSAHLLTIPFENLDIHFGKNIKLDIKAIFNKIVINKRGGFCYELNGLFYELLKSIGFQVKMISAKVYDKENGFGPEFDHMAIIAQFNKEFFLTDVGFGEFTFYPLKIELNQIQQDKKGEFKIEKYDDIHFQVSKKEENNWIPQYVFSLKERILSEYEEMCAYHQTSPKSHFTQKRLFSICTTQGRITFSENTIKIKSGNEYKEIFIKENAYIQSLWNYFKVKI